MDPERWSRVQELFHEAATLQLGERRAFVESRCDGDAALVADVLSLLEADADGIPVLDAGLASIASDVMGRSGDVPEGTFGAWRVREVLGEGGMGIVYLAEREDLGARAAVKVLRDAWLSPARRERFAAEQRTLAQLQHPSIARLFDAGTRPDGTPWIVMELVDGETITAWCQRTRAPLDARLRLVRDVCEAVQHAHRNLVVHRDLKPSNILITTDGSVKLLDFGIAKHLAEDADATRTRTGMRLLTPAYAAPEQLLGDRVGVHTDVYAIGVLLFELLAGRLPFEVEGRSSSEVERAVLEDDPPRPSLVARSAPAAVPGVARREWADLDVLCLTAMHRDAPRRYPTVDALARDVEHFRRGEPLEARPDSLRYRAGKFVRRNRVALASLTAVLALVVGLVGFYTRRLSLARDAAVAESARTQRIQRFTLNLLSGGEDDAAPAESLRAVTLVDRGLLEARSLDAEPAVQAELLQTLGTIYQRLGRMDRADSLLEDVVRRQRARVGPVHPDLASSLVSLALLRVDQAEFDDAEKLAREALAIDRGARPPSPATLARDVEALGQVLESRGKYDEAIAAYGEALALLEGGDSLEVAGTLYSLANAHYYAGHWATSDSFNVRSLAIYRARLGDGHARVAELIINRGAILFEQGRYAEAERMYREALAINRRWYGDEHQSTAANLTMLARPVLMQERLDEADSLLRRSLAIRERVYGPMHPRVASSVNEIGSVALRRERYDEAEAAYRRMLDIYRAVYGGDHYLPGVAMSNLGSVYSAQGRNAEAERHFRDAVAIFHRALPPGHSNTAIARIKLGRSLLRQGRFAEGERETRAGYDSLRTQATPSIGFLVNARKDLVIMYDSLGRPADAARFRAELADTLRPR